MYLKATVFLVGSFFSSNQKLISSGEGGGVAIKISCYSFSKKLVARLTSIPDSREMEELERY